MSKTDMLELTVSVSETKNLSLKILELETIKGDIVISSSNSSICFRRVKENSFKVTIRLANDLSPESYKKIKNIELLSEGEDVHLYKIDNFLVFGDDSLGYSVAKRIKVAKDSPFLAPADSHARHLVVTGIHGNFKDKSEAWKRASHYKDAKVISIS